MAYTYVITNDIGKVRFLLQDNTDTTARPALMQDAEIQFALDTESNIYMAAAMCAEALSARFRGLVSKTVGNLSLTYDKDASTWDAIATRLRTRGSLHMLPTAGGIEIADRDAFFEDSDLIQPKFFDGLHQTPGESVPTRISDITQEEQ